MTRTRRAILVLFSALLIPGAAWAQDELTRGCTGIPNQAGVRFCNLVAEAIEIGQPRIGLSLTGGNPVPGAASTVGMRIGKLPRLAVAARVTGLNLKLPPIADINGGAEIGAFLPSLNIDATIGILSGIGLLPTVGGFASVDLIASVGTVGVPEDDGFSEGRLTSWAGGVRLGILRESFTAPGISLTGMYRRISGVEFGNRGLTDDSYFDADGLRVLSARATVGKRLFVLGALAGVGYDSYKSDVAFGLSNPDATGPSRFDFAVNDFSNSRFTAFGGLYYTVLVLSIAGEAGWQSGSDFSAPLPPGRSALAENGAFYGSLAVRLSI